MRGTSRHTVRERRLVYEESVLEGHLIKIHRRSATLSRLLLSMLFSEMGEVPNSRSLSVRSNQILDISKVLVVSSPSSRRP